MPTREPLKTIVYVDGFNFYYGTLRGSRWKWLDLERFFDFLLGKHNTVHRVRYFTARVRPSRHDPDVDQRQDAYFQALSAFCPRVSLHFGHYLRHRVRVENADPPPATVRVWKNEEKGSDVNLALHLLNDAWKNECACAVVVSNDSDIAHALRLARIEHGKVIGLVTPGAPIRKTSQLLYKHADFIRPIRTWVLEASQLPFSIPETSIHKPSTWI